MSGPFDDRASGTDQHPASLDDLGASLTRRRLLQRGGQGALALAAGPLLGSALSATASAATPSIKRGGTLTIGMIGYGSAETLNPLAESGDPNHCRCTLLFDKLFRTNAQMQIVPELATKIEPSKNGKSWTLTVRSGVKWHDGTPLTADDVVYTIKNWANPAVLAHGSTAGIIDYAGVRKRGPLTVEIPLLMPVGQLPALLYLQGGSVIQNGATAASLAAHPIGTGPFKFGSFTPGVSSTFPANPNYWQPGMPYVDSVVVNSSFSDPTALLNALLAGDVNVYSGLSYLSAKENLTSTQIKILRADAQFELPFYMRVDKGPFVDVRVRQAMRLIVNRPALVETSLAGLGTVGNDLLGRYDQYYASSLKRSQDIEQAKSLLKQAGKSGLKVTLQTSAVVSGFTQAATLFAQQAKAAGVTINLQTVDPSTYFTGPGGYGTRTFGQSYYTALPSLTGLYLSAFWPKAPALETYWGMQKGGSTAIKLLFQAIAAVDPKKAAELWNEVQQQQFTQGGVISWGDGQNIIATSNSVAGLVPGRNVFDNFRIEGVWLKS
jgi:peptide/nickel transport system substrate-binding protein